MGTLGWGDKKAELSLKHRADLQGLNVPDPSQEDPSSPGKAGKDGWGRGKEEMGERSWRASRKAVNPFPGGGRCRRPTNKLRHGLNSSASDPSQNPPSRLPSGVRGTNNHMGVIVSCDPHTDLRAGCYSFCFTDESPEAPCMDVGGQCGHTASIARTYVRPKSLPSKDRKYKSKQNTLNSL